MKIFARIVAALAASLLLASCHGGLYADNNGISMGGRVVFMDGSASPRP